MGSAEDARALIDEGIELWWGSPELALAALDEVARRYGESTDPTLRLEVARALICKGELLADYELQRYEEGLAVFDEVVGRFEEATDPDLVAEVAVTRLGRAEALGNLARHDDALAAYDEVIARYDGETALRLREVTADARVARAWLLDELGREDEAVAAADDASDRLREATEPELHRCLDNARAVKGHVLEQLGREDEWLEEEVAFRRGEAGRLRGSTDPVLAARATSALLRVGSALQDLHRYAEALAPWDEAIERLVDADGPDDLARAISFRHRRAIVLTALDRTDEAVEAFDEIVFDWHRDPETRSRSVARGALIRREILVHAPDLDLDAILVCWQARAVAPRHVIEAAFRTAASGRGAPRTWEAAGLPSATSREVVLALDALLPELAVEHDGETLAEDYDGRGRLRLCRQIVSGELAPIPGAWVISLLDEELPGGDPRGIFFNVVVDITAEGDDPSDEMVEDVEAEIIRRARRVVKRLSGL